MSDAEDALIATAGRAFRQTRFYGEVYESEPTDVSEIPYLSASDYHRAAGLLDCIVDREAMIGTLPPYFKDASRFPFTVPEDEAELVLRQKRIVRAMKDLGVDFGASPRFLIVADGRRGPFACELAKGIYWEGFQASVSFMDAEEDIRREVAVHEPDYVVLACRRHLRQSIGRPPRTVMVVEHCGDPPIDDLAYPALLYADEVDLIGSRAAGRTWYDYDSEQLRIEVNPASGLSHVSKRLFTCFPLVRYSLGRRISTANVP
ncbi:hypothetical protein ACYOEI_16005 [Singulisphaera rosea]